MRRRFFQPKKHTARASIAPGNAGRESRRTELTAAGADTVKVVDAAEPDGVTVAGEKLHDAPEGKPEQAKETAAPNPFCGVTDTAVVPLCPAVIETEEGEIATEKSGAGRSMVYAAVATALLA